jgi:hypothetical protein
MGVRKKGVWQKCFLSLIFLTLLSLVVISSVSVFVAAEDGAAPIDPSTQVKTVIDSAKAAANKDSNDISGSGDYTFFNWTKDFVNGVYTNIVGPVVVRPTSVVFGLIEDFGGRIIGIRTVSGERRDLFSSNYVKIPVSCMQKNPSLLFRLNLSGLFENVFLCASLFGYGWKYLFFALLVLAVYYIFWKLTILKIIFQNNAHPTYQKKYFHQYKLTRKFWGWAIFFVLAFVFFMGVPVFNRILQLLTLEFMSYKGIFWNYVVRPVIFGILVFYLPNMWKLYSRKRREMQIYKDALKKAAAIEAMEAQIK